MPARCGRSSHRQGSGSCGGASAPAPRAFRAILGDKVVEVTVASKCWSLEDATEAALWFLERGACEGEPTLFLQEGHTGVWRGCFVYDFRTISAEWEGAAA